MPYLSFSYFYFLSKFAIYTRGRRYVVNETWNFFYNILSLDFFPENFAKNIEIQLFQCFKKLYFRHFSVLRANQFYLVSLFLSWFLDPYFLFVFWLNMWHHVRLMVSLHCMPVRAWAAEGGVSKKNFSLLFSECPWVTFSLHRANFPLKMCRKSLFRKKLIWWQKDCQTFLFTSRVSLFLYTQILTSHFFHFFSSFTTLTIREMALAMVAEWQT